MRTPTTGERGRGFKEVSGESLRGKTYSANPNLGTQHSLCRAPDPAASPAHPGSPFRSGAGGARRGAAHGLPPGSGAPQEKSASSRAPIAWSWGSGSHRRSAPSHPSPWSAAATQVARNRNRGREGKKEGDVKSSRKNQDSV